MHWLRPMIRVAGALLAFFVVLARPALPGVLARTGPHGCVEGNLIPNCNFDGPYSGPPDHPDWRIPQGWAPFVVSGSLAYWQAEDSAYGAPSLQMVSDGDVFKAGVFTQVGGLQPGAAYQASAGWFAPSHPPDDFFCRKLGIDPRGGTNPLAPEVVWGPTECSAARMVNYPRPDVNIDVSAVAQSSTVTVFAYVDHTYSTGMNYIFLDAIGLYEDTSVPRQLPPTVMPPTAAPAAAAQARQAAPPAAAPPRPTSRPTATATLTPTPTLTLTPTATATATATATPTITPTPLPTATPTSTPSSTLPPRPSATPGASMSKAAGRASSAGARPGLLWGGMGALGSAGLLGLLLLTGRGRRVTSDK